MRASYSVARAIAVALVLFAGVAISDSRLSTSREETMQRLERGPVEIIDSEVSLQVLLLAVQEQAGVWFVQDVEGLLDNRVARDVGVVASVVELLDTVTAQSGLAWKVNDDGSVLIHDAHSKPEDPARSDDKDEPASGFVWGDEDVKLREKEIARRDWYILFERINRYSEVTEETRNSADYVRTFFRLKYDVENSRNSLEMRRALNLPAARVVAPSREAYEAYEEELRRQQEEIRRQIEEAMERERRLREQEQNEETLRLLREQVEQGENLVEEQRYTNWQLEQIRHNVPVQEQPRRLRVIR